VGTAEADGQHTEIVDLEARLRRYDVTRYPVQHATARFHLGVLLLGSGRISDSAGSLRTAHEIFTGVGMRLEAAKALVMSGVAAREGGQPDRARASFLAAATAFADLEQPAEEGAARFNLGLVRADLGETEDALTAFASAHDLFLGAGQVAQAGAACREQATVWLRSDDPHRAVPMLSEAMELAERGGDLPGLGAAANALGLARLSTDDVPGAVEAFAHAVGAYPRTLRPADHAMAKANLALAYHRLGNAARARLTARQAVSIGEADPQVRAQAERVLAALVGGTTPDLVDVLDSEPPDRWHAIVRDEVQRWSAVDRAERLDDVNRFLEAVLARPGGGYALAESLLGVLLELPTPPYEELVGVLVEVTGRRPEDVQDRVRAVVGSALARFPLPQWQRLAGSLNTAARTAGLPGEWR